MHLDSSGPASKIVSSEHIYMLLKPKITKACKNLHGHPTDSSLIPPKPCVHKSLKMQQLTFFLDIHPQYNAKFLRYLPNSNPRP